MISKKTRLRASSIIIKTLFFGSIALVVVSLYLRLQNLPGKYFLLTIGLLGIAIYYLARLTKRLILGKLTAHQIYLYTVLILMCITLYAKYLNHQYWDYPALLIIPLFMGYAVVYLSRRELREVKATVTVVIFTILTLPMFGEFLEQRPRAFIPKKWYDRYDIDQSITTTIPLEYHSQRTDSLVRRARNLHHAKRYQEADELYQEAHRLEPDHPMVFFEWSQNRAEDNDLETAVTLLDRAIVLNDTVAAFYVNRGLLFYKLANPEKAFNDYVQSLQFDTTNSVVYYNLALLHFKLKQYQEACSMARKTESRGGAVSIEIKQYLLDHGYCNLLETKVAPKETEFEELILYDIESIDSVND